MTAERKPISFRKAVRWSAENEDLEAYFDREPVPTDVAVAFAALFEIPEREWIAEVRHVAQRMGLW